MQGYITAENVPYRERYYRDLAHSNNLRRMTAIRMLDNDRRLNVRHYNEIIVKTINEKIDLTAYYEYFNQKF